MGTDFKPSILKENHLPESTPQSLPSARPDLDKFRASPIGQTLTTNQGVAIADDQNSMHGGDRGPTLLEDFILREKITHFDHERIPERVVHARGAAAHGYFQAYASHSEFTSAHFLNDPAVKTPVFVRFSTVGGSRGSADTPRDVRGFAVKFYTQQGNYDLVGNNMPVFFIQDAIKFPDFVHAVKPEPHNEIPQASSAHDTLWDFVSLNPETSHTIMWLMSDRALPVSYRTMEGFGVHTYRFVSAGGTAKYVKFHWKPKFGVHSLIWDEAQKLMGKDPDVHRRDLYDSIENRVYPEWELGGQIFGDAEADLLDFDILDATKLIPEEIIPVTPLGKMVLDRNPDSYFAETEQVAFCVSHVVPGIDFTNDPLLQGRIFSYLDTQLTRLGGPNFHEIPINRPVCPFSNGQRDGMHRMQIDTGNTAYGYNTLDQGFPKELPTDQGVFASYPERNDGQKRRVRSGSFADHYSQATLFWNSMSQPEKEHIKAAFVFELGKVQRVEIRERVLDVILAHVHVDLARFVAQQLGIDAPTEYATSSHGLLRGDKTRHVDASPALSQVNAPPDKTIEGRKIAILAADGVDSAEIVEFKAMLENEGAKVFVLSSRLGKLNPGANSIDINATYVGMPSLVFDAILIPGGPKSVSMLQQSGDAVHFVAEAYKHAKAIAAHTDATPLLERAGVQLKGPGVVIGESASVIAAPFIAAIKKHRAWDRAGLEAIAA